MLLDFGPWRPDLPDLDTGCVEATNVVPGFGLYAPQSSLIAFSGALEERCQGAISVIDISAGTYWFAGDRNRLYIINTTTTSWSNISRLTLPNIAVDGLACPVGFGNITLVTPRGHAAAFGKGSPTLSATLSILGALIPAAFGGITIIAPKGISCHADIGVVDFTRGGPAYSTASTERWSFAQYANNIYATNYTDPIQIYSLASGTRFNDLGGGAPQARYLGVVKNFMVAVNTQDAVDGATPQRVRWSAIDNPASWTVNATTQADFQDLFGEGGQNQGIVAGLTQADAVILQERAVWRMTYMGVPTIFTFDMVEGVRGTPAPGSVIAVGGVTYYLGEDGFYMFDGAQSAPIGQSRIDRTFLDDADPTYFHRMSSVSDIGRKLIFWSYASGDAVDGNPDRILVYNRGTGEWTRLEVDTEILWRTLSFGYTLEELDQFGTIDTILVPLDSKQWAGGVQQLSAFDTYHRTAHFAGSYLGASITTREFSIPDPRRLLIREAWPIIDCQSSVTTVKIGVGARRSTFDSVSFAPATSMNSIGFCPQRTGDHFVRLRMSLSASTVWNEATGIDVQFSQVGWR